VSARATLAATVDVWSLGATLCEMLCGSPPFGGVDFHQLVSNVLSLNFVAAVRTIPPELRTLLEEMLQILPSDRASVDELMQHPFALRSGYTVAEPNDDGFELNLTCADCDDGRSGSPLNGGALAACWASFNGNEGRAWRHRILMVTYATLIIVALLWTQARGGHSYAHGDDFGQLLDV